MSKSEGIDVMENKKNDIIYNSIGYLIGIKSEATYVIYLYSAKIKVNSYDRLPLENKITFHNVIILIKSVFNTDKNITTAIIYS